jgi:hypothetical protein
MRLKHRLSQPFCVDSGDLPWTSVDGLNMADELDAEVKIFIVQSLACFDPPSKVVKGVKEEFGVTVNRQTVHRYNASKKGAADLAEQWKALFEETRKRFLEETADIGIANRVVRLRRLDRIAELAEAAGNHVVVMAACEAAAKEMGGAYTNRHQHELTGRDGKDLPAPTAQVVIYKVSADDDGPRIRLIGNNRPLIVLPDNGRD